MIEGLRQLPWLQERIRKSRDDVEILIDCDVCRGLKESNRVAPLDQQRRQSWGCPYEPADPRIAVTPWMHRGYTDEPPTTCPGYTTKLPEVIEINRARLHWKNGALRDFLGESPTENLLRGIEILEGAINEAHCWREPEQGK